MEGEQTNKFMMNREEIHSLISYLRKTYPKAFPEKHCVVLKKGIDLDICKDNKIHINRTKLRTLLRIYTRHPNYRKVHVLGALRHDLNGDEVSRVTREEVEDLEKAVKLLNQRKNFIKQHRQQNNWKQGDT